VRILHVSSEYPPQKIFGLGRYVSDLARELAAQGHDVTVLTNSLGGVSQDILDRGVHVRRVDFPPPPMPPTPGAPAIAFNVHLQQRAHSLGREGLGNPEVVVSHDWLTAVAGHRIARRLGVPHVWTVHDTVHGKRAGRIQEIDDRVAHALEHWATRTADRILVNSRAIGEEIEKVHGAVREKVDLLHPGIDPASCASVQGESRLQAFRRALAGPEDILITFAGRLDLEKGVDTLVNAFAILKGKVSNVRLAIAGRGRLLPIIENHVKGLKLDEGVTLCGYLEGQVLRSFYSVSDIHVCPSHYEPFGLVALEAMSVGTPVVVSDTGGLRDIVSSNKVGRTFPPGNPGALAEMLAELARSRPLRSRLGRAGRKHANEQFGWSRLAPRAVTLYERALEANRAVEV
jgi:glycosyltransferase involved in cell wall biosynthesis